MKPQGREIKINTRGEDVARLHQALESLGFQIPEQELQQRRFGQATRAALLKFRQGL